MVVRMELAFCCTQTNIKNLRCYLVTKNELGSRFGHHLHGFQNPASHYIQHLSEGKDGLVRYGSDISELARFGFESSLKIPTLYKARPAHFALPTTGVCVEHAYVRSK